MIRLEVSGMTCEHCEARVKKALSEVPGVRRVVAVRRDPGEALLEVAEGEASMDALVAAVEEEGYEARPGA